MRTRKIIEVKFYNFDNENWALFIHDPGYKPRYHVNPSKASRLRLVETVLNLSRCLNPTFTTQAMWGDTPGWAAERI